MTAADAEPAATTTFGWRELGISPALYFGGANATQTLTIPTPDGVTPVAVTGLLRSATNIPSGHVEAETPDGRFLGSVMVPDIAAGRSSTPFSITLDSLQSVRNQAQINLVLRVTAGDPVCGPPPTLVLSDLVVSFSGEFRRPSTLQQFFPVIAPDVDIYVDPNPTPAEKVTALRLVTAVAHHYQPAGAKIVVRQLPRTESAPPPDGDGLRRAIVIRDVDGDDDAGVRLITDAAQPYVVLSGKGPTLEQQVALFRDRLLAVAQTDSVSVQSSKTPPPEGVESATFGQLHLTGGVSVLGEATISLDLGAASFTMAEPGAIDIHLLADYTPVDDDEKGTMIAAAGSMVLDTIRLDRSGRIDTRLTIPAEVAARNPGLVLTVAYEPGARRCTPRSVPMRFQVDAGSTASMRAGDRLEMGGFASLPQAFIPTFQLAMDGSDPDELPRAATIVGMIQQLAPVELRPIVVSLDQAGASTASALIIADAQTVRKHNLDPPIDASGDLTNIAVPDHVSMSVAAGLTTLQSFAQNDRTIVLLTTSGDWDMSGPLFDYLRGLDGGWRDLSGDVLVAGQGADPQMMTVRAEGPLPLAVGPGDSWRKWAWLSLAAVGVSLALIAFHLLRRRSSEDAT